MRRFSDAATPMLAIRWKSNGMYKVVEKLRLDFHAAERRSREMDATNSLIVALCTRIGMIMEDTSVIALNVSNQDQLIRLEELHQAIGRMSNLIAAAKSLSK